MGFEEAIATLQELVKRIESLEALTARYSREGRPDAQGRLDRDAYHFRPYLGAPQWT